jgi:hypothetical protein
MPFITPTWEEGVGYTGDNPLAEGATGWSNDENKGWFKWVPSTEPTLSAETIQNLTPYNINTDTAPGESRFEISGGQAATDPNAYYSQLSSDLAGKIWENNAANGGSRNTEYNNLLESIKDVNPAAYYNAQIQLLGSEIGHASAMGEADRQAAAQKKLYDLAPQAISAGVTPEQLNATANSSYSTGANLGSLIKNQAKASSGFWKDNLIGTAKVMAMAFGAAGLDAALGAGAGMVDASGNIIGGGAEGAAYGAGGAMGPTYGELGITGLPEGGMGPTYAEMGYTGLNQQVAIDAANAASQGLTGSDALDYANKLRQAYGNVNSLAKMFGGTTGTQTGAQTSGTNPQQLASLLSSQLPTQSAAGGLYRMNQNPFTFGTQGQTPVSQGMYDVSGTNPMANALRKA